MNHIEFAECADVAFHNIDELQVDGNRLLHVKGLIFHSSIVADHLDLYPEQHTVHILVSMALTRPGKSGLFELYIPIPERISAVTFGTEKKALWQRDMDEAAPSLLLASQNFG